MLRLKSLKNQSRTAGNSSIDGVVRQLNVNASIVWKVLKEILQFYPHKISHLHELKLTGCDFQLVFALTFLAIMDVDEAWPSTVLWSDKAHFYLNGLHSEIKNFGI